MGNVERCDKTLPTNEMMFALRRDPALRRELVSDLDAVARQFCLSPEEVEAIRAKDPRRLMELGVHQYYVPQLLRVFFGARYNENQSAAMECYARAFPDETARALAHQARRREGA